MTKKILYLIDGTSVVYRSYYAIKLSNSRGVSTGAIYGFFNALSKLRNRYGPEYISVCFDVSRKTHRQKKFKEYKIHRPPPPDDLNSQFPFVKKIIKYLGINCYEEEGYEADDLIAALTLKAVKKGFEVVIVATDKDMYQLINGNKVVVCNTAKNKIYNQKTFIDEFGFTPSQIVDYLSLVGDASDNIPGARGIGKVGAKKLIDEFGTIEGIFDSLEKLPEKTKKMIVDNKKNIILSKELIKLEDLFSFEFNPEDFKIKSVDTDNLYRVCRELELKSILKEIPQEKKQVDNKVVSGLKETALESIKEKGEVILSVSGDKVFLFCENDLNTYEVDINHAIGILADESIKKIAYNFKQLFFDLKDVLFFEGAWFDIKIAAYLVNPSLGDYSLSNLCSNFLDLYIDEIPLDLRVSLIYKLQLVLREKVESLGLSDLCFNVEIPLSEVLFSMESSGIKIDQNSFELFSREVDKKCKVSEKKVFQIAGHKFNLNSPKQLQEVLFGELKLPTQKKIKTGFSTNEDALQRLVEHSDIAKFILDYRHLNKLQSTYLGPFAKSINPKDSKLHASFNQTVTQTGRLSSSSPNLQNIPIRGEFAQKFRKSFIPSFKGGVILSGDYSQIELRVLAHFSNEKNLKYAFENNLDIHTHTASLLFDIDQDKVSREQRETAKRVNFGIVYGISSYGLSRELKIPEPQSREFIDNYFLRYPGVKSFIDKTIDEAKKRGYVKTIMGRIRYLPDIDSSNFDLREFSRRQAMNTPIQGTAADLIKIAMVRIHKDLIEKKFSSRMILQVHDELLFDVKKSELDDLIPIVKNHMESSLKLSVPIVVNFKFGENWLDMEPVHKK